MSESVVIKEADGATLLRAQITADAVHSALSSPLRKVTVSPGIRYTLLEVPLNITVTVEASVHEQVDTDALVKVKRVLHGHVAVTMPAESVGVSKESTTAWPLSVN